MYFLAITGQNTRTAGSPSPIQQPHIQVCLHSVRKSLSSHHAMRISSSKPSHRETSVPRPPPPHHNKKKALQGQKAASGGKLHRLVAVFQRRVQHAPVMQADGHGRHRIIGLPAILCGASSGSISKGPPTSFFSFCSLSLTCSL
jgi:hypothetical protein